MSNKHTVTVELLGNMAFRAITDTGHEVVMDAAPELGGTDAGPRPMELLLVGLGGCTGMDVISMLRKMRQDVTAYEIQISGVRAPEDLHQHPRGAPGHGTCSEPRIRQTRGGIVRDALLLGCGHARTGGAHRRELPRCRRGIRSGAGRRSCRRGVICQETA